MVVHSVKTTILLTKGKELFLLKIMLKMTGPAVYTEIITTRIVIENFFRLADSTNA